MAEYTDEQYFNLADKVYENDYLKKGKAVYSKDGSQWKVINYTDNYESGLQAIAVVPLKDYQKGKTTYENVVFVSRGSEGREFMKDWIHTDVGKLGMGLKPETDAQLRNVAGDNLAKLAAVANHVKLPGMGLFALPDWYVNSHNQFFDYQTFVNQTVQDFHVKDYSFTGHSLGGALALFMAV
ncbi:cytoplasmic protein, partial [Listeria floridensis FSL S10-1187]